MRRTNGINYWGGKTGYGYGLGWSRRYVWFPLLFTPNVFATWYPPVWEPYYIVQSRSLVEYDNDPRVIFPENAYRINRSISWPENLPSLPTFTERGIDSSEIRYETDALDQEQKKKVFQTILKITAEQSKLETEYAGLVKRGYRPVPDLDRERFSWVKEIPQQQQQQ